MEPVRNEQSDIDILLAGRTHFNKNRSVLPLCCILLVLICALAVSLILGAGVPEEDISPESLMDRVRSKNVIECPFKSINNFFYSYYTAMANGNTEVLENSYNNPDEAGINADISSVLERITNLKIYVTPGLNANEIAVFVGYDIYFNNIDVPAPAVDSYYIYMNESNGNIQIMTEMYTDETINQMLTLISFRNPVRTLIEETESELYETINQNKDLRNLYVVMNSMSESGA